MKRVFLILLALFMVQNVFGQFRDRSVITGGAALDTLTDASTTYEVIWDSWHTMQGSLNLSGQLKKLSTGGTDTVQINFYMLNSTGDYGTAHTLNTYYVTDSSEIEINVSDKSWWNVCKGYKTVITADTGDTTQIKLWELAK